MGGGVGTDIGYVNIVGPGEGVGGQTLGILILGEGVWGLIWGCSYYGGSGSFGTYIGDVNIVGGRCPRWS